MKDLTLEYIAGFVDGEGTFTIICKNEDLYFPIFDVSNTNLQIIKDIKKYFSLRSKVYPRHGKNPKRKTCYHVSSQSIDECKSIATLLEPYLRIKKEHAQIIMQYPRTYRIRIKGRYVKDFSTRAFTQKLRNRITLLNKTGPSTQEPDEDLQQETDPQLNLLDLKQKEVSKP